MGVCNIIKRLFKNNNHNRDFSRYKISRRNSQTRPPNSCSLNYFSFLDTHINVKSDFMFTRPPSKKIIHSNMSVIMQVRFIFQQDQEIENKIIRNRSSCVLKINFYKIAKGTLNLKIPKYRFLGLLGHYNY